MEVIKDLLDELARVRDDYDKQLSAFKDRVAVRPDLGAETDDAIAHAERLRDEINDLLVRYGRRAHA
jgi:hypothetical protein